MRKIALYGKGGIGKSTTVSNVAAALNRLGNTVLQIGCDPKADSTLNLTGGTRIPTVLEALREKRDICLDDIVTVSESGVLCVEAGGPIPGTGCAGRGIISAFEKLEELGVYERHNPDIVLYDVLGDVVCGGFAMPIRGGYAQEVCIVTSGEMMSLYAATNIATAVRNFESRGYAALSGLIFNAKGLDGERSLVEKAALEIDTSILFDLPRASVVQEAEALGCTVVEAFPDSEMAAQYRALAELLIGRNA